MANKIVILLMALMGFLLMSCEQNVVGPSKNTTSVVFKVDHSGKANHSNFFFLKNNRLPKVKPKQLLKTSTYDEVKLAMLDMTKFKDSTEFENYWNRDSAGQALVNNVTFDSTSDIFDIVVSILRGYSGAAFSFIGDYSLRISDSVAKGSVYVNPGLNYYFYAFRQNGRSDYNSLGAGYCMITPDSVNTIELQGSGSGTQPPNEPSSPFPADLQTGALRNTTLQWSCTDPQNYPLKYDVLLGTTVLSMQTIAVDVTIPIFIPGTLLANTTYYWYIVAKDNYGNSMPGPTWQFTTGAQ